MEVDHLVQQDRVRRNDVFAECFFPIRGIFTDRQWRAIYAYWHDCLSHSEAAKRLGVSRKAVSSLLARAWVRKNKEEHRLKECAHDLHKQFRAKWN